MRKGRAPARQIESENFELMLDWLDADREKAARKYERIRTRLIKIFVCRGAVEAEDLADETIDRVMSKIKDLRETYVGNNPALYFYGVAKNVYYEWERLKRKKAAGLELIKAAASAPEETEITKKACFEKCLQKLEPEQRLIIRAYYGDEAAAKRKLRNDLAEKLDISVEALRVRIHRLKSVLQDCVKRCLDKNL